MAFKCDKDNNIIGVKNQIQKLEEGTPITPAANPLTTTVAEINNKEEEQKK